MAAVSGPISSSFAPTLTSGDIVIGDNLGSYKVASVREAIKATRACLVFLPAYSRDLNPIEQVFAKLKTLLRRAEPRTRTSLWQTIAQTLYRFTPNECRNYLAKCGYGQSSLNRAKNG